MADYSVKIELGQFGVYMLGEFVSTVSITFPHWKDVELSLAKVAKELHWDICADEEKRGELQTRSTEKRDMKNKKPNSRNAMRNKAISNNKSTKGSATDKSGRTGESLQSKMSEKRSVTLPNADENNDVESSDKTDSEEEGRQTDNISVQNDGGQSSLDDDDETGENNEDIVSEKSNHSASHRRKPTPDPKLATSATTEYENSEKLNQNERSNRIKANAPNRKPNDNVPSNNGKKGTVFRSKKPDEESDASVCQTDENNINEKELNTSIDTQDTVQDNSDHIDTVANEQTGDGDSNTNDSLNATEPDSKDMLLEREGENAETGIQNDLKDGNNAELSETPDSQNVSQLQSNASTKQESETSSGNQSRTNKYSGHDTANDKALSEEDSDDIRKSSKSDYMPANSRHSDNTRSNTKTNVKSNVRKKKTTIKRNSADRSRKVDKKKKPEQKKMEEMVAIADIDSHENDDTQLVDTTRPKTANTGTQYDSQGEVDVLEQASFEDCIRLREALCGKKIYKDVINSLVAHRDLEQRLRIRKAYRERYGREIVDDIQCELRGDYRDLVRALFEDSLTLDASLLSYAVKGLGTNEAALIHVLASRTANDISNIKARYSQLYGHDVTDDVKGDTSGSFQIFCLVQLNRDGEDGVFLGEFDDNMAEQEARRIWLPGERVSQEHENTFIEIVSSLGRGQFQSVAAIYEAISGFKITDAIKKFSRGDIQDGLLATAAYLMDSLSYHAETIHRALRGFRRNDRLLINALVTRMDIDLEEIKAAYKAMFNKSLESAIMSACSGDYAKLLSAILTPTV